VRASRPRSQATVARLSASEEGNKVTRSECGCIIFSQPGILDFLISHRVSQAILIHYAMIHTPFTSTNSFRRLFCLAVLPTMMLLFGAPAAKAQDDDTLITQTSLVQLNVGVVDSQGRAITTLTRNNFTLYEDGVKQTIQSFSPTDAPFSLVMLLDVSGSTINFRQQLKQSAVRFLDALGPDDRVAVIAFNAKVKTLATFSTNHQKAAYAISIAEGAGETYFYEALKQALTALRSEGKQRRKAIVVLTDGLDTQMRNTDRKLISKAQTDQEAIASLKPEPGQAVNEILNESARQGVTIFPLALPSGDPKRLPLPDPVITGIYTAARTRLQALADRTGGRMNEIQRLDQLARIYVEVAADLRALYTVAYQAPGQHARDGKWHEIRIDVTPAELIARTRPGYFAK
jgi:VWFA-related protein